VRGLTRRALLAEGTSIDAVIAAVEAALPPSSQDAS